MRRLIKIAAAALAFVPAIIVLLNLVKKLPDSSLVKASLFFNFPALSLTTLVKTFSPNEMVVFVFFLLALVLWSAFLSVVFWRFASMFLGDDELGQQKFDWKGFQLRFACGFVVGFLPGWRCATNLDGKTILICMTACGVFVGLAFGAWRENFWQRPL